MLIVYVGVVGIEFMFIFFDLDSLKLLIGCFGMKIIKVFLGEIINVLYLFEIGKIVVKVIVFIGMCMFVEVEVVLSVFVYVFCDGLGNLFGVYGFVIVFVLVEGKCLLVECVMLLYCIIEYLVFVGEVNLCVMDIMVVIFGLFVGYFDYMVGINIFVVVVVCGVVLIEKYFMLDCVLFGFDYKVFLEFSELSVMVVGICEVELVLGDGVKVLICLELNNCLVVCKSLVVKIDIKEGEVFSDYNLIVKWFGSGVLFFEFWFKIG